jgi:hypothetical protein
MEQSKDWLTDHHYLNMGALEEEAIEITTQLPIESVPD